MASDGDKQSPVEATKVGEFWAVQYHPEYSLWELARLTWCRIDKLVKGGFFIDRAAGEQYVKDLEDLYKDRRLCG
jgi:GMP synthase (glutamine-hydrolysing)